MQSYFATILMICDQFIFLIIITNRADGASVMDKFGKLLPCEHIFCYAHTLHLAVCDILYKKSGIQFDIAQSIEDNEGSSHVQDEREVDEYFDEDGSFSFEEGEGSDPILEDVPVECQGGEIMTINVNDT